MQDMVQTDETRALLKLCPTCHDDLVVMDYRGVIIDQCSRCNGYWVEKEAMEKIIHSIRASEPTADCCKTVVYETRVNRGRKR